MADNEAMQAMGPLSVQQPQALPAAPQQAPQQQGLIQQLLPLIAPIITGLGAAATTSRWSGPGAAAARGGMGALAGYAAMQTKPKTPEDRYYEERIVDMETKRKQLIQAGDTLAKTPEERAEYDTDPKGFVKRRLAKATRVQNIEMLQKYHNIPRDVTENLTDEALARVSEKFLTAKATNKPKPTHVVEMIDGKPRTEFYDADGQRLAVGGEARPTAGAKGPTAAQVQGAALQKYVTKSGELSDEEQRIVDKLLQDPGTHATAETLRLRKQYPDEFEAMRKDTKQPKTWRAWISGVTGGLVSPGESPAAAVPAGQAAPTTGAPAAAATEGSPPNFTANPGVTISQDDKLYTDGTNVYRLKPGAPEPKGLTRIH